MKNHIGLLWAANIVVAALSSPLWGQQSQGEARTSLQGHQILKVVFATLDENEDGLLQQQEAQGVLREKLGRRWPINAKLAYEWRTLADANSNGELTWLETLTLSNYVLAQIDERIYDDLMKLPIAQKMLSGEYEDPKNRYCASESDESLDLAYRKPGVWQLTRTAFVEMDRDRSGQLDAAEIRRRKQIRAVAGQIDKDASESLSQGEVYTYLLDVQTQLMLQGGSKAAAAIANMYKQMGCSARGHIDPNIPGRIYGALIYSQAQQNRIRLRIPGAPGC